MPEPAGGARPDAGAARRRPDGLPGGALQGRGDRRAGRPAGVPRGGSARRQGQRPRLPQRSDGAGLVDAGLGGRPADVAALQQLPQPPSTTSWITYVRCHDDIGWAIADEDAWAVGLDPFAHRRFLSEWYSGSFPGSWARGLVFQQNNLTGDRRISGSLASLAGLEAGDPDAHRAHPAGARDHPRLRRRAGALDGRRARPPQRPGLGRRPRARRRQPVGAPAADAVAGGARRARDQRGAARPPRRTPLPAAPARRLADRGLGPPRPRRAAGGPQAPGRGAAGRLQRHRRRARGRGRRPALARAAHLRPPRRDQRPARPSSTTARSGWRRTPPPGSTTATVPDCADIA